MDIEHGGVYTGEEVICALDSVMIFDVLAILQKYHRECKSKTSCLKLV